MKTILATLALLMVAGQAPASAYDPVDVTVKGGGRIIQIDTERGVKAARTAARKHGTVVHVVTMVWPDYPVRRYYFAKRHSLPPCINEDGGHGSCVWVADERGNGVGKSLVKIGVRYFYVDHDRARAIVRR